MRNKKITICSAVLIALSVSVLADARIIAYSAPWCGFCVKLERYLRERGVEFERINVDRSIAARRKAEKKSGQRGIPVLDWEGEIITGFGESQKKEIDRLIAGGKPVKGKFVPREVVQAERKTEEPEKIDYEEVLFDFVYEQVEDLKNLFALAGKKADDADTADILEKLYDAHIARIVYETTFTEQFSKKIEQLTADDEDDVKLTGTVKNVAGEKYSKMYNTYRDARAKNSKAAINAQQALKLAVKQEQSREGYSGPYNQNAQGHLLKLWACAAVNPRTGGRLQPDSNDSPDLTQDAVTARAVKIISELTNIQNEVDETEEPNSLTASE